MQLLAPSKHNCNCNCCNKYVCPCSLSAFLQAEINISLQLVSQCGLKCLFYQRSKVSSFQRRYRLLFTHAAAECSTGESWAEACAPAVAAFLTGTLGQLLTARCNWRKCCPTYLPWLSILRPPPLGRTADVWIGNGCLSPDDPSLVGSTFCMFFESCTGWWDCIIGSLLACKEIQPCLVNTRRCTGSVIHVDNKLLQFL